MRKIWGSAALAATLCILLFAGTAFAEATKDKPWKYEDKTFAADLYGGGMGLQMKVDEHLWARVHKDGDWQRPVLHAGVTYHLPRAMFFWRFYGGGGVAYDTGEGTAGVFIVTGSEIFSFLFSEVEYDLAKGGATARSGIRIRF